MRLSPRDVEDGFSAQWPSWPSSPECSLGQTQCEKCELFKLLGNTGTGFAIDHYLKVQSYGVCSIGRIEVGNKPHIVSVGVLGHVYTFDKQDIERTVDQLMRETINGHDDDYDS